MKTLAMTASISACLLFMNLASAADPVSPSTFGADRGERPIGVEPKDWIAVSDNLGFVVVTTVGTPKMNYPQPPRGEHAQALLRGVTPPIPAAGYFVVKTAEGWRRIVVLSPADLAAVAG